MFIRYQRCLQAGLVAMVMALAVAPLPGRSAEIAPIRLTDVEGTLELAYQQDERDIFNGLVPQAVEERSTLEKKAFLLTHGYVYHPNFMKFDLGGGTNRVDDEFESLAFNDSRKDTFGNALARLRFLEKKPYPLTAYYEKSNPVEFAGLVERILQDDTRYGGSFALRRPLLPFSVIVDGFKRTSEGRGLQRIIDDDTEEASLRIQGAVSERGNIKLSYINNQRRTASGDISIPIQTSDIDTETSNIDTNYYFGSDNQGRLRAFATYTSQETRVATTDPIQRRDIRFFPDFTWKHSDNFDSFYRYNLYNSLLGTVETTSEDVTTGFRRRVEQGISLSADIHGNRNETPGVDLTGYGAAGLVNYRLKTDWGEWRLGASGRFDINDQDAVPTASFVESVVLPNPDNWVALSRSLVISLTVSDPTNANIIFVEGTDYEVRTIGVTTEIRRLASSVNLNPGDTVVVTYVAETGGSYSYSVFTQSYQANLTVGHVNMYVRYRDSEQDLLSGTPSLVLNDVRNTVVGGRLEYPFNVSVIGGVEVSYERNNEDIAPFDRNTEEVSLSFPFYVFSSARLGAKHEIVDNANTSEDVDLIRYSAALRSRLFTRTDLSINSSLENDTGSSTERETRINNAILNWRLRQLIFSAEARSVSEKQGSFKRQRKLFFGSLRREF